MSKSSDQVVLERRLKPIYDAIDGGNNKKAIQEAEKVLKKHPSTHTAKVLKALALIRSDKHTEAWPLIEEVESLKEDIDENTLQAMCHCFKEAYTPERISTLYERVCARFPKNEQYLTHLFMSYVRVRNYKLQQKTALSLFKEFQRNPYYFWNVMSIVMQAISGDTKLAQSMLYPLAEKMVVKMIESNSIQAEAECNLYVLILEGEGKFEEAARFLESDPLARRFMQQPVHFLFYRILSLHQKAGNHALVIERCISELKNDPDDWTLWTFLFDSAFERMKEETCSAEEKNTLIDRLVERVLSLIEKARTLGTGDRVRGIYLARLTLITRLLEQQLALRNQLGTLPLGEPLDHLVEYVSMFHAKPCCFTDIRSFVSLLGEHQIEPFLQRIAAIVDDVRKKSDNNSEIIAEDVKWADIVCSRLRRAVATDEHMSALEKRTLCAHMVDMVQRCADSDLAAAAYAQLAAHLLWDLYTESEGSVALYELILLMEWVHSRHPSDPLCRLVLCRAYAIIGATAQLQKLMQSLDIKNVQRDTLGYLLFGLLEQYGRFNAGIIYYTELSVLFDQTEKEISECLTTAYKNGNFPQVPRLVEFLSKITKSIIAVGADIQSRALSACFAVEKIEHVVDTLNGDHEPIDFSVVEDNRDFNVIPSLNSGNPSKLIEEVKQRSYFEQVDSMKLRDLLLKCVASIAAAKSTSTHMTSLLTQLRKHRDHCQHAYADSIPQPELLQSPPPVFVGNFVSGAHIPLIDALLSSAIKLMKIIENTNSEGIVAMDEKLEDELPDVSVIQELVTRVAEGDLPPPGPLRMHIRIRHCSFALHTFALASIAVKLIERRLEGVIATSGVHRNKKGASKGARKHTALLRMNEVRASIHRGVRAVDELLIECQNALNADDLIPDISEHNTEEFTRILLSQKANVDSAIVASYAGSLSDMRETVDRVLNPPWA
uniref:N-terminal acetyltransferase B complex subunit MDM20 homolog n=1 Tax=Ascaris suum TaxID=6253 RepID=F1KUD0_ASCSU